MQQQFEDGAGITLHQLQSGISLLFITGMMIWAVWIIISTVQSLHHPQVTFSTVVTRLLGVFVLLSLSIALVYHV